MAKYQAGALRDVDILPEGMHTVRVELAEEKISSTGKFGTNVMFKVIDSGSTLGLVCWKYFVFGTESDPLAEQPETWTIPRPVLPQYAQFLQACGVDQEGDTNLEIQRVKGSVLTIVVFHKTQAEGTYAGKTNVEVRKFISIHKAGTAKGAKPRTGTADKPRPVADPNSVRTQTVTCRDCQWEGAVSEFSGHECNPEVPF